MSENTQQNPEEAPKEHEELLENIQKIIEEKESIPAAELEQQAQEEEANAEKPRINVEPSPIFDAPSQENLDIAAALNMAEVKIPEITNQDKEEYLKAVLLDTPFCYTVSRFGGDLKMTFQTRSLREQEAIPRLLNIAREVGDVPEENNLVHLSMLQYYTLAFSLLRVGTKAYTPVDVNLSSMSGVNVPGNFSKIDLKADPLYQGIKSFVQDLRGMNQIRLSHIIDGLRTFEAVSAKIASLATAENFLEPQD